ncbi:MAG TPA: DUF935 family protein [Candidatus Ozemobacteraceae bacterium]|nr:DUF935 family protein [Candidatus Ozemobacteraceae bacterium]
MGNATPGIWINDREFRRISDKPAELTSEFATRRRAGDLFGYGLNLPNPDEVLRNLGLDISVYKRLLVDSQVGACITSRKSGTKALDWGIDRKKAKSRVFQVIEDAFANLDIDRIIGEILDAPMYGYQALEVLWKARDGLVLPVDVIGKPQSWFTFDPENELRFKSVTDPIGEPLPPMKFLLATHEATYENPYGFPVLSRCFWPVAFKKGGLKFWVTFVEKYGGAFAIGKHPRSLGQGEVDALASMLEAMIQSAIAVIPDDSSVEIKEAGGKAASADIYERLLVYCDHQISKGIVGQTLTTEVNGTGSYAASQTHKEVLSEIVTADTKMVVKTFNLLVRWSRDMNFGTGVDRPAFRMWHEEDVDKAQAERDKTLADTGQIRFKKKYWMREYGFAEDDIEEVIPASGGSALPPAEFSEGEPKKDEFPDQAAIDEAGAKVAAPTVLQAAMEAMLRPYIELIGNGASYEVVMEKLAATYPAMKPDQLATLLERAIFAAETWGRIHAQS